MTKPFLPEALPLPLPASPALRLQLLREEHAPLVFPVLAENRTHLESTLRDQALWQARTLEEVREALGTIRENAESGLSYEYGLFRDSPESALVGALSLQNIDWPTRRGELGFWLSAPYEGQGLLSAALRVVEEACFEAGFHRLEIIVPEKNLRSQAVARRAQFRKEALLRDDTRDEHDGTFSSTLVYSKLRSEYERATRAIPPSRQVTSEIFGRNPDLPRWVEKLRNEEHCHTILLYGSRARGTEQAGSDTDLVGIRNHGRDWQRPQRRSERDRNGDPLDIFLYPEFALLETPGEFLRLASGVLLWDEHGFGARILEEIERERAKPVPPLPSDEAESLRFWYERTLARASRGDLEARYRQSWMLFQSLEDFFRLQGHRYPGPKEALRILEAQDSEAHALFARTLENPEDLSALEVLVRTLLLDPAPRLASAPGF